MAGSMAKRHDWRRAFPGERQREENARLREEVAEARGRSEVQAAIDAKSKADTQLEAFQSRLQALHASQVLSEDELYIIEDVVADCIEHGGLGAGTPAAGQVTKMIVLSEKIRVDGSLARQLRRKFT